MDTLIVPSISINQRLDALYAKLVAQFGKAAVQLKIVRGFGLLVNSGPGPQIQLNQLQANPVGGTLYPAQALVAQTDAFIFSGARIGMVKAATAAALKSAVKYTYADVTTFPTAGGENASVQSFWSGGQVSLYVNTEPVMQPLALSYFENEAILQSAAGTKAVNPTYNERFQLLPDDFGIAGGNQNYFSFDMTNADTAAISPSAANYAFVELIGYSILNGNTGALNAAKQNQICV